MKDDYQEIGFSLVEEDIPRQGCLYETRLGGHPTGDIELFKPTGQIQVGYDQQGHLMAIQPVEVVSVGGKSPMAKTPRPTVDGCLYLFGHRGDDQKLWPPSKTPSEKEIWEAEGKDYFTGDLLLYLHYDGEIPALRKDPWTKSWLEEKVDEFGKTKYKIAKEVGVNWATLSRWLADPELLLNARFGSVVRLGQIIGMTPEELYKKASEA